MFLFLEEGEKSLSELSLKWSEYARYARHRSGVEWGGGVKEWGCGCPTVPQSTTPKNDIRYAMENLARFS